MTPATVWGVAAATGDASASAHYSRAVGYRRGTTMNRAATRILARHDPEIGRVKGGYLVDDELVAVSSRHDGRPVGPRR